MIRIEQPNHSSSSSSRSEFDVVGRRCVAIRRVHHHFCDDEGSPGGLIEFSWADGTHTTIDARADWTLCISPSPWMDLFISASNAERGALDAEVGRWVPTVPGAGEALDDVVGREVTACEPVLNEVGELAGLRLSFGSVIVLARVWGGEILAEVTSL